MINLKLNIPTPKDISNAFKIRAIKKHMPKKHKEDGCSFSNGTGFLKWTQEQYSVTRKMTLEEAYRRTKNDVYLKTIDVPHNRGIAGRYLDDSGMYDLNAIWYRIMCINNLKEYGQVYFALNPHMAKGSCLNDHE